MASCEQETVELADGRYVGPLKHGRFEGEGVYEYKDGTRYEGEFKNGAFNGRGRMVFANGVFDGIFKDGVELDGDYVFHDGLEYQEKDWTYLSAADRRFHSEKTGGPPPPLPELPPRTYDTGEGTYFNPKTGDIHLLADHEKVRTPDDTERQWIKESCRKAF